MYVVFFKQKPAYEMRISDWSSDGCSSDLLAREVDTIREQIPQALRGVEAFLDRYGLGQRVRELAEVGSDDLSRLASRAGGYAIAAGSGVADFVLVLVAAIFLASDPATYRRGLLLMLPGRAEATAALALDDAARGLKGWRGGQAAAVPVVGATAWGGGGALGVTAADRRS